MINNPLTSEEVNLVTTIMEKLKPGFLPFPIFNQVARLVVMPIIDVVPVRKDASGNVEVLLTQRENNDPLWPDMWHNPGTVVRATDHPNDYIDAFTRIFKDELGIAAVGQLKPTFVTDLFHHTRRGAEATRIYWLELTEEPRIGTFFDVHKLPDNTIETHIQIIHAAAEAFQQAKAA